MPARKKWGGVARRGADNVNPETREERREREERESRQRRGGSRRDGATSRKPPPGRRGASPKRVDRDRREPRPPPREPHDPGPPPPWEPEQWIQEPDEPVRAAAGKAVARGTKGARKKAAPAPDRPRRKAPEDVSKDIGSSVAKSQSAHVEQRLMDAARAFERERYKDADRILKGLVDTAPGVPAVHELYGLNLYRLGRWNAAAKELEHFRQQTGSVEQHPVLADSYRALGRHTKTAKLWDELRTADAPAELVTEGRIVAAGSLADRGKLADAIRLLEKGPVRVKKPKTHHLRLWYALADLYERAGDTPKARALFERITAEEPDFADAAERTAALG